jgi:hypothetical protein
VGLVDVESAFAAENGCYDGRRVRNPCTLKRGVGLVKRASQLASEAAKKNGSA